MSEATANATVNTAVLELPDEVRLAGSIDLEDGGTLILRDVRRIGGRGKSRLSLKKGAGATLHFDSLADSEGPIERGEVRISGIQGNDVQLTLTGAGEANAKRCLQALARPPEARPRIKIPARHRGLVAELARISLSALKSRLDSFLENLSGDLQNRSRNTRDELHASALYSAATTLRQQHGAIAHRFLARVEDYFQDLAPPQSARYHWETAEGTPSKLDLVDLEEFESFLAVDRIVRSGRDLHGDLLEYLTVRLASVLGINPLEVRLPVHVAELCTALRQALIDTRVSRDALPRIMDEFNRHVVSDLDTLYEALNEQFIEAGVYPDLEEEIRVKGSVLERAMTRPERPTPVATRAPQPGSETLAAQGAAAAAANETMHREVTQPPQAQAGINPQKLYSSVVQALNFTRSLSRAGDDEAAPAGPAAASSSVIDALTALQRDASSRSAVQDLGSLSQYLTSNTDSIEALQGTVGPGEDSRNQLELVDKLFSTIQQQLDVSQQLSPALGQLQIPLAKLSLLEPHFFLDQKHAARAVVDKLSQLAAAGNFPNKMLEDRVATIISQIVEGYDRDSSVFDEALGQIDKLVDQQSSAHERNVERVIKTQEGQERLRSARIEVDKAIRARLPGDNPPRVLVDLINRGWRDLLVLTYVKQGEQSANWQEHLRSLELLALWLSEQQGESAEDMSMLRGLEAEPLLEMLEQEISAEQPGNVELAPVFGELRKVLSGDIPVDTVSLDSGELTEEVSPRQFRKRLGKTHRLRRWVDRVETLQPGSWLTYRDREGRRKRMKLAWVSPDRHRFIFVNERGQKVADLNAVQLARKLSHGAQPPSPAEGLSLVDQSMYGTLEEVQKTLSFSRNHDQLTRLINRGTFVDQVNRALVHAHRKGSQHAVLHLNIDEFNLVNTVYDHVTGDQVLTEFAKLLSQLHGKRISSARLGDDDFGILLIDQTLEQAEQLAEKIRADIEQGSVEIEDELVSFTVSIGVAPLGEHTPDVDAVIAAAETAMHQAKQQGRNRVAVLEENQEDLRRFREQRNESRRDLEKALATDRFVLRAQPIVQTAVNGKETVSHHYELLLGLLEKDGSLASPQKFIAAAERHGFMTVVDRWVVREAFRWVSRMMDEQKVVPTLAINLSGNSITDDEFMEYLFEQISDFGVGTNRLCFEITETGTISNLVKAADFVRAFRNIGCKFSLDDFGTGLASHNYLRELPVDYVKIDGTFVVNINENRNDFTMARSINDLAHFLGQETIAESVENQQIVDRLEEIGVDYLQGWGIGYPKPLDEIAKDLSSLEK